MSRAAPVEQDQKIQFSERIHSLAALLWPVADATATANRAIIAQTHQMVSLTIQNSNLIIPDTRIPNGRPPSGPKFRVHPETRRLLPRFTADA